MFFIIQRVHPATGTAAGGAAQAFQPRLRPYGAAMPTRHSWSGASR